MIDARQRKLDLEVYFEQVEADGVLPHYPNAFAMYDAWDAHGIMAVAGGYQEQPEKWREDMLYVGLCLDYAGIDDEIAEIQERIAEVWKRQV